MSATTDWPAWMPELVTPDAAAHGKAGWRGKPPVYESGCPVCLSALLDWYERAKAADPALRRVATRTATGPTPDFEALRPRLDTVFGGDDDAEC